MPLDDREQRILEEIERQFYQDDPRLAESVRGASCDLLEPQPALGGARVRNRGRVDAGVFHVADARRARRICGDGRSGDVDRRDPATSRRSCDRVTGVTCGQTAATVSQRLESSIGEDKIRRHRCGRGSNEGERPGLEGFTAQQACRLTGVHGTPTAILGSRQSHRALTAADRRAPRSSPPLFIPRSRRVARRQITSRQWNVRATGSQSMGLPASHR